MQDQEFFLSITKFSFFYSGKDIIYSIFMPWIFTEYKLGTNTLSDRGSSSEQSRQRFRLRGG